jgi:hypothetical protein
MTGNSFHKAPSSEVSGSDCPKLSSPFDDVKQKNQKLRTQIRGGKIDILPVIDRADSARFQSCRYQVSSAFIRVHPRLFFLREFSSLVRLLMLLSAIESATSMIASKVFIPVGLSGSPEGRRAENVP